MKTLLLAVFCFLSFSFTSAQVFVNDVNINELNIDYVQLVGQAKFLSLDIIVSVDYGQERKLFKTQMIKDGSGRSYSFNSMVDALNFMAANGWEYVNSYPITTGDQLVYHYLLKRVRQN